MLPVDRAPTDASDARNHAAPVFPRADDGNGTQDQIKGYWILGCRAVPCGCGCRRGVLTGSAMGSALPVAAALPARRRRARARARTVSYWYWEEDLEEEEQRIQKEEGKK